jgi:hypothetical protein
MDSILKKAESIRKAVEAYETDFTLGIRGIVTIYEYLYQLIYNRLTKRNQSAPNIFIAQQKI